MLEQRILRCEVCKSIANFIKDAGRMISCCNIFQVTVAGDRLLLQ